MSRVATILGAVGLALLVVVLVLQLMIVLPGAIGPGTAGGETRGISVRARGRASAEPDLA